MDEKPLPLVCSAPHWLSTRFLTHAHTHTHTLVNLWANSVLDTHVTASFLCKRGEGLKGCGRGMAGGREGKAERNDWGSQMGAESRKSSSFGTTVKK